MTVDNHLKILFLFRHLPRTLLTINSPDRVYYKMRKHAIFFALILFILSLAGFNLVEELSDYPNCCTCFDKCLNDYYVRSEYGTYFIIYFSIIVSEEGKIEFKARNDLDKPAATAEDYWTIEAIDGRYAHGHSIEVGDGVVTFIADCAFYDFKTHSLVVGQA